MPGIPSAKSPADATRTASRSAATCRWAVPTLFLRAPFWFEAENAPWACVRETASRVLDTTNLCASCPHWEPRRNSGDFMPTPEVSRQSAGGFSVD
jgi:hypothetical protein